ncbi:hypothetical protein O3M35_008350 [Rhynocoris fuscipes]|uniref:Uncharacterized protein n=1 Tax=Rhynocoris fuscipes TaxID=488301 RepID=A0AAW1D8P0_9HEMI
MEQPHNRHTSGAQPSLQHNGGPPPYGSTFRPEPPSNKQPTNNSITTPTPPQPVRGGVQVLPPVVPPRAPVKTKPKPPVPPKRDQLTRLTTVKKDPIPIHRDDKDEAKSLEALEKKINETSSEPQERTFSETIEHFERQGSFAQKKKVANYENTAQLDQPVYASINPETKKLHNSESKVSLKSEGEPSKESSSEEESGATADIWVRAIDSPVKKTEKVFRSNSAIEESPVDKPIATHRTSIDNSQLTRTPVKPDKPEIIVEKDVEDDRNCKAGTESLPCSRPSSRATSRSSSPANFTDKEKKKISAAEALGVIAKPCPRPPPGKRIKNQLEFRRQSLGNLSDSKLSMGCSTSCPSHQLWSSFGECQEADYKRHERSRGQSADSRTLQRLKTDSWETQSYSSTLSRIGKYSTSKYFAKTSTCPAATTVSSPSPTVSCQERPKSTCNCGRHSTVPTNCPAVIVPKDVGKRTFSVEELRSGGFIRGSNTTGSTRGSFGKSPRVTFALSEDEMGATGPTSPPKYDPGDPRRVSVRARSYDADDRAQVFISYILY